MSTRCPVHDEVVENGQDCPRLGGGADDCNKHLKPKEHEKARVLADGGRWNDKTNKAHES